MSRNGPVARQENANIGVGGEEDEKLVARHLERAEWPLYAS
jgi:hypothetical protein